MIQEIRQLLQPLAAGPVDDIGDQESLQEAGVLNSLELLELITALEDRYGIGIDNADVRPENLDSIRGIADLVARKRGEAA